MFIILKSKMRGYLLAVVFGIFLVAAYAEVVIINDQKDVNTVLIGNDDLSVSAITVPSQRDLDEFIGNDDFEDLKDQEKQSRKRPKRWVEPSARTDGLGVTDVQAYQYCQGIRVKWKRPPFPVSPDGKYKNSEFSYYNVYRSSSYFTSVRDMKPYASGRTEYELSEFKNVSWMDRDPIPNDFLWYGVTIVTRDGREQKEVTPGKGMYIGAFGPLGARRALTPQVVKGVSLRVSGTYSQTKDNYFVVWDVDKNNDGVPDRVIGAILRSNGQIATLLEFTVTVKDPIRQGNPKVAYNPMSNEYLVVFEVSTKSLFQGNTFIASSRVSAANGKKVGQINVQLKANEKVGAQLRFIPVVNPHLLYNSVTGGYSLTGEMVTVSGRRGVVFQNIGATGKSIKTMLIFNANLNARNSRIFLDTKRGQLFITAQFPSSVVNRNSPVAPKKGYVFIVTKRNATGDPLGPKPSHLLAGETNMLDAQLSGYYSEQSDRLHLYWFDIESGRKVIKSSTALVDGKLTLKEENSVPGMTPVCYTPATIDSLFVTRYTNNGGQIILWEENQSGVQKVGGLFMRQDFTLFSGKKQSSPSGILNTKSGHVLAVWIEEQNNVQSNVFARLIQPVTHKCPSRCASGYNCMREGDCIKSYAASKPCRRRNGGCSDRCLNMFSGSKCSCSDGSILSKDGKKCTALRKRKTALSFLVASLKSMWHVTSYRDGTKNFQRLPFFGTNFVTVTFDPVTKLVYWSDGNAHTISRGELDGSNVDVLVRSVVADGLVVNHKGNRIYWADAKGLKIESMALDKSNRKVLIQYKEDKPRALDFYVDGSTKYMYWSAWEKSPRIERALLVGDTVSQRQTLISTAIVWPNGLVIDGKQKKMYWADAGLDKIEVTDLMGKNRVILGGAKVQHPYSLLIANDRLFWTDWTGHITSVDLASGYDAKTLAITMERPSGMHLLTENLGVGKSCSDPGTISNGEIVGDDFSVDEVVTFKCTRGYTLVGPFRLRCQANGKWNSRKPVCVETRCKYPGKPYKGNAHVLDYSIGGGVVYTCNPGFKMVGHGSRVCTVSGKWSGRAPRCVALPVFGALPQNTTKRYNEAIHLSCKADNPIDVKVQWFKDGQPFTVKGTERRIYIFQTSIFITQARFSDAGLFTCRITNDAGFKEATALVKVLGERALGCGVPTFNTRPRIFGGRRAGAGAHPWMALLWNTNRKSLVCGGTLINQEWVLTAAHCLTGFILDINIKFGKVRTDRKEQYEQVAKIKSVHKHPQFDSKTFESDIALIRLSTKVSITDYVLPVCLPYDDDDFNLAKHGTDATVVGWGSKTERQLLKKRYSKKLQEIDLPIVDRDECKTRMSHISENMICAGAGSKGDACQGDSGGPMTIFNPRSKKNVLVGVVSWGEQCARDGTYGVYTRVTKFISWISTITQKN